MESTYHHLYRLLLPFCFLGFSFSHWLFSTSHGAKLGPDSDKQALLSLKKHVTRDPFGQLTGWNDSSPFCQWNGVFCSSRHGRVVALVLEAKNLTGTISPYVGNMSFLRQINLRSNFFHGEIPDEIGRLHRLQSLGLTLNLLQGAIPISLGNCSELRILDLVDNNLEGTIPDEIGKLSKLTGLGLAVNRLTGPIPKPISNLTSLAQLSLSENSLSGDIPHELNNLRNLNMFQISANRFLTGSIPAQLFNLSSMDYFGVSQNQLVGKIPTNIGFTLPNVRVLMLGGNRFTGSIPDSITNATKLERLLLERNGFTGPVPNRFGQLKNLLRVNLGTNSLGSGKGNDLDFLHSLVNCSSLEVLAFNNNTLSGTLPGSISNLSSSLNFLLMGANKISGKIPIDIHKLENLLILGMEENLFDGTIPSSIGYLRNLQVLSIFGNGFSGEIPDSLGNLSSLVELGLDRNSLEGRIPSSLGGCSSLQRLGLRGNNLSGTITKEVIGLASLSDWLDLSENRLNGPIPDEIHSLRNLRLLDLSENDLSGEIPSSIENCNSLEVLILSGNFLQGSIPSSLKYIKGIQELDLSRNNFTGPIPDFLTSLPFTKFVNLSFNDLYGPIPERGIFTNLSAFSIVGNDRLCGGIEELHLKNCGSMRRLSKLWKHLYFRIIIIIVSCLIFIFLLIILLVKRNLKGKKSAEPEGSLEAKLLKITYTELSAATNGFSSTNLVGSGSYGSVYKGCLVRYAELNVAIKVIDLHQKGAIKSFVAECEVLRGIRHRNLVKIITSCSSIDHSGNEFKALVFEYMSNGSLEKWLHNDNRDGEVRKLSLVQRLSIAVDVGHALDYLHHHVDEPVVHCDVKPSNVLLDESMVARVGDFGLAKLLYDKSTEIHSSLSTNAFKGTIGYVAPEYGLAGEVSTMGDVYGFGILILELFTGKRPTDEMFMEDLSLHSFVEKVIPDGVTKVTDPNLVEESVFDGGKMEENLVKIFKIGILCSKEVPRERMDMKEAVAKLQSIKDGFLG